MLIDSFLKFRNDGGLAAVDEVLHPDCVIRYSNMPEDIVGLEAFKEYDKTTRMGFSIQKNGRKAGGLNTIHKNSQLFKLKQRYSKTNSA